MRATVMAVTILILAACQGTLQEPPPGPLRAAEDGPLVPWPFQAYIGPGDDIGPLAPLDSDDLE